MCCFTSEPWLTLFCKGGVIYPIVFRSLQPSIGFGWTTRVIAFIALGTILIPIFFLKPRTRPSLRRKLVDPSALRSLTFSLFSVGLFFAFMGLYVPFFYVQSYASDHLHIDENISFYLLVIMNAGSIFGRLIPNFLADKIGPFNMLIPASLSASVLAFAWIGITNEAGLIVFAVLYGFFSGSFVSLPPVAITTLSPNLGLVGVRLGMSFAIASIGLLIGTPIAGALLPMGWPGMQAFGAASVLCALFFTLAARGVKTKWILAVKA